MAKFFVLAACHKTNDHFSFMVVNHDASMRSMKCTAVSNRREWLISVNM